MKNLTAGFLLFASFVLLLAGCKKPVPVANFSMSYSDNTAPCEVSFTNNSTDAASYVWEFGDGGSSADRDPKHTFTEGGTYSVKLTAISEGGSSTLTKTVEIKSAPPVANFTFTGDNNQAPCQVVFTNTSVNAVSYLWEFGDGMSSTEANPAHVYTEGGSFNAKLTAYGQSGLSSSVTKMVTIKPPVLSTNVTFNNTTFTDIYITLGGDTKFIPAGGSVTYYTVLGSSASFYAYTSGTTVSGAQVGALIEWNTTVDLSGGIASFNLNVNSDYFFLFIRNYGTHVLTPLHVNWGLAQQTIDNIRIPNDNINYNIGYYKAFTNTIIRAYYEDAPNSYTYWYNLGFTWSQNQYIELTNSFKSPSGNDPSPVKVDSPFELKLVPAGKPGTGKDPKAIDLFSK